MPCIQHALTSHLPCWCHIMSQPLLFDHFFLLVSTMCVFVIILSHLHDHRSRDGVDETILFRYMHRHVLHLILVHECLSLNLGVFSKLYSDVFLQTNLRSCHAIKSQQYCKDATEWLDSFISLYVRFIFGTSIRTWNNYLVSDPSLRNKLRFKNKQ